MSDDSVGVYVCLCVGVRERNKVSDQSQEEENESMSCRSTLKKEFDKLNRLCWSVLILWTQTNLNIDTETRDLL